MPKSSPIQTNFSGGELGPLVEGRVDAERHGTGVEICQNYIPTLEGPLVRLPGTKRVASVKDPSKPPRFIPFKYSNTEQYILEFGERYIRFFTDGGQVITSGTSYTVTGATFLGNPYGYNFGSPSIAYGQAPFSGSRSNRNAKSLEIDSSISTELQFSSSKVSGSILEIPTLYDHNMIQNIGFTQKGDTLWLMHSSMPTYTLQRFTPQDWDLKYFQTKDGPYLPLNTYLKLGDSLRLGFTVWWRPDRKPTGSKSYEGFNLTLTTHSSVKIANVVNNNGLLEVRTSGAHGFGNHDKIWINGVVGTTGANNGSSFVGEFSTEARTQDSSVWEVNVISSTSLLLVNSIYNSGITIPYVGSGQMWPALFNPQDAGRNIGLYVGGQRYYGYLGMASSILEPSITYLHPIQANVALDIDSETIPLGSTVISVWQLGTYNRHNGWPASGSFNQNRLFFAGIPGVPTEFNGSRTGEYSNFNVNLASSLSVIDTNALQFSLVSESQDLLQWVKSGNQGLYFGSDSVEFLVSPSKDGQALTPTNINNEVVGNYGSANINPVRFGDSIIYVQSSKRKIRELRFFANLQSHKSTQINQLSDHIALPQISGLATQKEPLPMVWGYKTDGGLISMSYSRDDSQIISGWASHELGGRSDSSGSVPKIKSIETIRDSTGTYDQLWMAVQRFTNGTSDVVVEYMVEPYRHRDPSQKQRDAFYVHCGATYDSSLVISNITTGSALITVTNHGLSRNDLVLIDDVIGLNSSLININGVIVNSNLVNAKVFVVGSTTTNNFFLQDFNSSIIVTKTYSPYFSGGKARKLVSSIGGLGYYTNEELDVLADGGYQGKITVASGGILTLKVPAAVVHVGYGYKSRVKTLVMDKGSATGSAVGQMRKTYQTAFRLKDVGDFSYGGVDFNNLHSANFGNGDEQMLDSAIPLYTGIYRDGIEQDVSFYGQVYFEQSSPLPGMIQSITYLMDEYDL